MLSTAQLRTIYSLYTTKPPNSAILEVGFGRGEFLDALLKTGWEGKIKATELSADLINKARVRYGKKITVSVPEEGRTISTDIVCLFEVLEHIMYPKEFLQALPGNTLYLSVPNKNRWFPQFRANLKYSSYMGLFNRWRLLAALPTYYEYWDKPPNHLCRYTAASLADSLDEGEWKDIEVRISPVQPIDIVRGLISLVKPKKITADYDEMRGETKLYRRLIVKGLLIACWPLAKYFSRLGYQGGNLYATAKRT